MCEQQVAAVSLEFVVVHYSPWKARPTIHTSKGVDLMPDFWSLTWIPPLMHLLLSQADYLCSRRLYPWGMCGGEDWERWPRCHLQWKGSHLDNQCHVWLCDLGMLPSVFLNSLFCKTEMMIMATCLTGLLRWLKEHDTHKAWEQHSENNTCYWLVLVFVGCFIICSRLSHLSSHSTLPPFLRCRYRTIEKRRTLRLSQRK